MPKLHNVEMTLEQMEQLARDAAICAGACIFLSKSENYNLRIMPAAKRILKILKLDKSSA